MNNAIQLMDLTKIYNEHSKIEQISFTIRKGEIVALCGGNGAGKSTLIKLITGIIKPTSGEVLVDGQPVQTISKQYRECFSYMPDDMLFPRQLTGIEVLRFFAGLRGSPKDRVDELLHTVGLFDERNRQIKHYSKGMQQRLSFAQALLADTPLLILDEPTNGLDPYWVYRFKEILQEEKQKGKAILFTTHILPLVEEIADQAAFIEKGKLLYFDQVTNLILRDGQVVSLEQVFFEKQMNN
ncbi:ABC transporter ATP-binding protein [Cytobacillus spongiae]|jgi:ABC-type multidrug transport system ATPase subunit|uniref:ABC transporter ATP-binding protein n=1 Tax=Cytobacillus spongiae TaxID=2901381 RepID=UPI001F37F8FA|nr:ABC transporter ATP-binding protein [Cytobacillus spongiae]UII56167.1 ABC transporter ATP-binding protein [Cytobacillus spongiae]